jgi:hypothetical protein
MLVRSEYSEPEFWEAINSIVLKSIESCNYFFLHSKKSCIRGRSYIHSSLFLLSGWLFPIKKFTSHNFSHYFFPTCPENGGGEGGRGGGKERKEKKRRGKFEDSRVVTNMAMDNGGILFGTSTHMLSLAPSNEGDEKQRSKEKQEGHFRSLHHPRRRSISSLDKSSFLTNPMTGKTCRRSFKGNKNGLVRNVWSSVALKWRWQVAKQSRQQTWWQTGCDSLTARHAVKTNGTGEGTWMFPSIEQHPSLRQVLFDRADRPRSWLVAFSAKAMGWLSPGQWIKVSTLKWHNWSILGGRKPIRHSSDDASGWKTSEWHNQASHSQKSQTPQKIVLFGQRSVMADLSSSSSSSSSSQNRVNMRGRSTYSCCL